MDEYLSEIPLAKNASSTDSGASASGTPLATGNGLSFGQGATESLRVNLVSEAVVTTPSLTDSIDSGLRQQSFLGTSPATASKLDYPMLGLNSATAIEPLFVQSTGEESSEAKKDSQTAEVPENGTDPSVTQEVVAVPPDDAREAIDQIVNSRVETLSSVLLVGFLLMALIHVKPFRIWFFAQVMRALKLLRNVMIDLPQKILHLPVVQKMWRNRTFVRVRRVALTPFLISIVGCRFLPWLIHGVPLSWWWVSAITVLSSLALNSRLGRDAQELTAEWVGNAWYKLRARVVMAVIDWVIDFFRMLLNFLERLLYAVDEWLRFHSDESWLSIVVKAVLGVI
ncbi:MAG: hypothetical protein U0936_28310, partial [Planctomycetaceae bacterium]